MYYTLLLSVLVCAGPPVDHWPSFRGDGSSVSHAIQLPVEWSPTKNIAWRTTLSGYGQSSPVVWGGLVFTTAIDGDEKDKAIVSAVDLKSGKIVWWRSINTTTKGKNNPMMSRAAPTPCVDADALYAFVETGDVVAFSHTGMLKWHRSLTKDYGAFKNNHGLASSPVQTSDTLIVLVDDMSGSYLLALEKGTGKNRWKTERPAKASWTSPVVMPYQGRSAVVVSSSGSLTIHDADTGKLHATHEGLVGNNIPSATIVGQRIIVGAGENRMKPDRQASAKSNCCVELRTNGDQVTIVSRWQGKKALSHHASPLVHRGCVYFVDKSGVVHCVDFETGEEYYSERLDNPCWTTPIAHGDHVYFFGKEGITTVLKAGSKYERVASNRLWSVEDFKNRSEAAKAQASATLPKPPEGKGPGGGAPLPKEEVDAIRFSAVGDVVYGVAAVEGYFILRTGTELIAIHAPKKE